MAHLRGKRRSLSWNLFIELGDGKAKCKLCERILSAPNTCNLMRHLKGRHPQVNLNDLRSEASIVKIETPEKVNVPIDVDITDLRLRRQRSIYWKFYSRTDNENKSRCNMCEKVICHSAWGVSNLVRHIRKKHPKVQRELEQDQEAELGLESCDQGESSSCAGPASTLAQQSRSGIQVENFSPWVLFTETGEEGRAKCRLCCDIVLFLGHETENLTRHIQQKHPKFSMKPQGHLESSSATSLPSNLIDVNVAGITAHRKSHPVLNTDTTSVKAEPSSYESISELDNQLLKLVVKDYQSASLVEEDEFKNFVHLLNSSHSLPNKKTLKSAIFPKTYNHVLDNVKRELQLVNAVTMTAEGWTSANNECYISVTAHFLNERTELQSHYLDCFMYSDQNSSDNLAAQLLKVMIDWDITDKVAVIVSNNILNMDEAARMCQLQHIPCFVHTVSLIVQTAIQEMSCLHSKVRSVVEFFSCSLEASRQLAEFQKHLGTIEKKLKQEVPERWTSTLDMFQRFLLLRDPVLLTLALMNSDLNLFQDEDWLILQHACHLLNIFREVLVEMSLERSVTLSKVLIVSKALIKSVKKTLQQPGLPEMMLRMASVLELQLVATYASVGLNPLLYESAILDPRFKHLGFHDESIFRNTSERLQQLLASMCSASRSAASEVAVSTASDEPTSSLWEDFDVKMGHVVLVSSKSRDVQELDRYLKEPVITRTEDPLHWWKERKNVYPNLYEIMKSRLSIPASSVSSQKIFSNSEQNLIDRRNSLSCGKMSQVMFLHFNL